MLAIEIEFLTGRYVATAHNDRDLSEWPPHPARLFSALVAEWGSVDEPSDAERAVLIKLEAFPPPGITASGASERTVVTHYVPVNDPSVTGEALWRRSRQVEEAFRVLDDAAVTSKDRQNAEKRLRAARDVSELVSVTSKTGSSTLPVARVRQARTYPSVTPEVPHVTFAWPEAELDVQESAVLDGLLERVTRLGHSSSLTNCRLITNRLEPTLIPNSAGTVRIRGVEPGQLDALVEEFRHHQAHRPRTLPSTTVTYARPSEVDVPAVTRSNMAGDWWVLELNQRRLGTRHLTAVTAALRGALLAHADDIPAILHGHDGEGRPSHYPHVAFLGLPDVGHEHSSGRLMGLAVMLPAVAAVTERRAVLRALGRWGEQSGELTLKGGLRTSAVLREEPTLRSLTRSTWASPAYEFVSATPLALPWRARKAAERANEWDLAAEWVADSCEHVGLPRPEWVQVSVAPLLMGAEPANKFPAFQQGRTARRLVHARVRFAQEVEGPVVLGSGRFAGLGLMRPTRGERDV